MFKAVRLLADLFPGISGLVSDRPGFGSGVTGFRQFAVKAGGGHSFRVELISTRFLKAGRLKNYICV
jgi:hypothetical protein